MEYERSACCRGRGVFVPLLVILFGVIFLLDQFHWVSADRAFAYFWPAVLILFGLECLSWRRRGPGWVWGVIAIGAGAAWIAQNMGYLGFDVGRLWPLLLIAFGVAMLVRGPRRSRYYRRHWEAGHWGGGTAGPGSVSSGTSATSPSSGGAAVATAATRPTGEDESWVDGTAVLGGFQRRITVPNFRGGHITSCLGGYNLDLSRAEIAGESAVIDIFACFGGGEIRVPDHWIIDVQVQQLLGGCSDETRQTPPPVGAKRLIIQGTAVFGGVVIKN